MATDGTLYSNVASSAAGTGNGLSVGQESSITTGKEPIADPITPKNIAPVAQKPDPPAAGSLDSLLSPQDTKFDDTPHTVRTSVAESENLNLDEVRLSSSSLPEPESLRPQSSHSFQTILNEKPSHQKTVSTSTIRSTDNAGWTIEQEKLNRFSNRVSIDGQLKLQEDFARLQENLDKEPGTSDSAIDWDFWGAVISDYTGFATSHSEELARAIERGIPATLRGMMWQLMTASKDPELEATYLNLLKESSSHEKAITRDLGRTFPQHDFFHDGEGIGQENLFNVLKAYSLYDTQVGYCQGLPFVVAILLLNMPDEEAFSLLVRLMYSYGLRGHFLPEMPRLQLRLFQFDRLLEELLPVLHVHFLRQGVKSSMYCSQWLLTLFSYRFPMPVVYRIYDNCLANGIEAIFGFCLALMQKNEDQLLRLKFDEILSYLNNKLLSPYRKENDEQTNEATYDIDGFVNDALGLRISPFMLDQFAHEYEDMVRTKEAHQVEMDNLRATNRSLSAQVKALEASLAQLNTEHVEVLNELVMSRLRNEETEEQLVKYKLLYAEAMHENEDAMSSHRKSSASLLSRKSNSQST